MEMEVVSTNKDAKIVVLNIEDNLVSVMVNDRRYDLDIVKVENGIYSVLYNNKSFEFEIVDNSKPKTFSVNHRCLSYKIEMVDSQSKYLKNRHGGSMLDNEKSVLSPMPGKVVKIEVSEGDKVTAGQGLIIISAMKMENEFNAEVDGIVKKIHVKEEDTVDSNQILIELE